MFVPLLLLLVLSRDEGEPMPTLETADESAPDSSDNSCVAAVSIKDIRANLIKPVNTCPGDISPRKKMKNILMDKNAGQLRFFFLN